jgi:predicted branched-subunit amino acid permease
MFPIRFFSKYLRTPAATQGLQDMLAPAIAMAAWGAVTGVAMVQSGLSTWQAVGMSLLVYAGSAQLASLPLLAMSAPLPIVWLSALVVNLRFVIYSVASKPFLKHFRWPKRLVYGFAMTDALAAEFLQRFDPQSSDREAPIQYYRAAAVFIWLVWQSSSMAGIVLAQEIPPSWGREFVATLALIAMILPMMIDRAGVVCVLVAGFVALLSAGLPLNLGLLLAVLAGVAAAIAVDRPQGTFKKASS